MIMGNEMVVGNIYLELQNIQVTNFMFDIVFELQRIITSLEPDI